MGWTQAFASVGGLLVTSVSAGIGALTQNNGLPTLPVGDPGNSAWRYTLMTGLLPALLIALLLPFVPESAVWLERKRAGTLKRPKLREIFASGLLRITLVTTALSACAYAAAFGTLQVTVSQGVPGLPDLEPARAEMRPYIRANQVLRQELGALPKETPEYGVKQ